MKRREIASQKDWLVLPTSHRAKKKRPAPNKSSSKAIGFRPARRSDLLTLASWLVERHVQRFYQKTPISLDEIAAEYGPIIRGETPDICHLAVSDGTPFAYLQCYRNVDYPDWAAIIGASDGVSVDLFIGDPAYLHRGYGRLMLHEYLQRIAFPHFGNETRAYIAHELANTAALRCSQAAGFKPLREFFEEGVKMLLLAIEVPIQERATAKRP
jgi:aminoglycoside 6'-N-acetyltransferase